MDWIYLPQYGDQYRVAVNKLFLCLVSHDVHKLNACNENYICPHVSLQNFLKNFPKILHRHN
jgi:hypothetical protein